MVKRFLTLFLLVLCCIPMIAQEPVEYHIDEVSRKLYPRPEWYIKLTTDDNHWTFCYDILTDEIVPGKVYTIDEMLKSDCQAYDNWERESHKFETATYCETYAPDGTLMIEGTATTADGMNIILHYGIDPLPVATDTVEVVTNNVELQDLTTRGAAIFVGETDDYVVSVGLKCKNIAGEYKTDDLYLSFCYVEPRGGEFVEIIDGHATVEAVDRGYTIDGYFLAEDACCYHVLFTYQLPEPIETRILKCDNLVVNTTYAAQFGEIIYEASNEDWELELWVNTDKPFGYFSGNIVDASYSVLTNRHTKEMLDLYYADFVVGTDETTVFLRGGMMARDKNYYILELSAPLTVDTRTVELNIPDGGMFDNTANNVLQLYGTSPDGSQYVSIALKTTEITTSTFDRSQTYRDYTYVEEFTDDYPIFYEPYMATINIIPASDGGVDVEAYLRCDNLGNEEDHPLYIVRMHCLPEDVQLGMKFDAQNADFEEHIAIENVAIDDSYIDDGYVWLDGYDPASRCTFSLEFNIDALDPVIGIPAGTYTVNDTWAKGTISASRGVEDGVVWPSYLGYGDADGSLDVPIWLLQTGTVTVANVDGKLSLELDGQNSCKRSVHLTVGAGSLGISPIVPSSSASRHDAPARKMYREGQLLIKRGSRLYDTLGRRAPHDRH